MEDHIRILVIEDEEYVRKCLEYNLNLDGFEIYIAEDGYEGLEIARETRLDLILLDWILPELNGMEVLSELKSDSKTADIPVFMLTAKSMPGDISKAFGTGADDYITKPFNPMLLGKIIMKKMKKSEHLAGTAGHQ